MRQHTRRYSVFFELMQQSSACAAITTLVVSFSLSAQASVACVKSVTMSRQATADSRSNGAQADKETQLLKPGEPVSREIAGGQVHTFRIALAAGQFMRVVLEQKTIDLALALIAPDGKQVVEVNITSAGRLESLSAEAAASGDYRLTVRAIGAATLAGAYQVQLEVRATATELDHKRIAAERLLAEGSRLSRTGSAQQALEEAEQALALWRELRDRYWEAHTLNLFGNAYNDLGRDDKAIESYERALQIRREVKDRAGEGSVLNNLAIVYNDLSRWRGKDPIRVSGGHCSTTAKGVGKASISEAGRQLLAKGLQRLLDAEGRDGLITRVLRASRNDERDQPPEAWTAEFERKARTIIEARCSD